jgi:hypothetical protein
MTGGWRKLRIEELLELCSSPSIIRIIKSRKLRWAGEAALICGSGYKQVESSCECCNEPVDSVVFWEFLE